MNEVLGDRSFRLQDIEAALHRAALYARRLAAETGTPLVLYENGRIVKLTVAKDRPVPAADRKPT